MAASLPSTRYRDRQRYPAVPAKARLPGANWNPLPAPPSSGQHMRRGQEGLVGKVRAVQFGGHTRNTQRQKGSHLRALCSVRGIREHFQQYLKTINCFKYYNKVAMVKCSKKDSESLLQKKVTSQKTNHKWGHLYLQQLLSKGAKFLLRAEFMRNNNKRNTCPGSRFNCSTNIYRAPIMCWVQRNKLLRMV